MLLAWSCVAYVTRRRAMSLSTRAALVLGCVLAACVYPAAFALEANDDNPLAVTSATTTDGRVCAVGPYGWFCDPPAGEYDSMYYTQRPVVGFTPVFREGGWVGAIPTALTPLCIDECVENCRPPCPLECVRVKFDLRVDQLSTGSAGVYVTHQFYVNPYNGKDGNPGTRELPWETLKRAQAQVRFLRTQNTEAPDSSRLAEPMQIWIRSFDAKQTEDLTAQVDNSRYMGYTIKE